MPTIATDDLLVSDLLAADQPLDAERVDSVEMAHIMRRVGLAEGEPGTSVSAFNSSI
jgi:hypothetical protein